MTKRFLFMSILLVSMCLLCGCENREICDSRKTVENYSEYGIIYEISEFLDTEQYDRYMKDDGFGYDCK